MQEELSETLDSQPGKTQRIKHRFSVEIVRHGGWASPRFPPGAGVAAAAAAAVKQIAGTLADIVSGVGLQAEASARHPGRLVHGRNMVLPLKL